LFLTETLTRIQLWTRLDHGNDASVQAWLRRDGQFATDNYATVGHTPGPMISPASAIIRVVFM
jgi:hypothetical protein